MAARAGATTVPIGIIGPSDTARQIKVQSARTVNLFPEISGQDAKAILSLHSTPGIAPYSVTALSTPTRGQFVNSTGRRFAVSGIYIYEILGVNTTLTWGNLPTATGRVTITENNALLIFGDGTGFYILDLTTGLLTQVTTVNGDTIRGTISLFIDQFTLYIQRDSGRVYYSAIADPTTVDDLDFFTAEGAPDNITAGVIINGVVRLFGPNSVEDWYDTGGTDNAFAKVSGSLNTHGCAAPFSVKVFDNATVYVGQDADGNGVVWRLGGSGSQPVRVSTHAVEFALSQEFNANGAPDISQVSAQTYSEAGHAFYMLNLPSSTTWVMDAASNNMWHERAWLNTATGKFERVRQDHHIFWQGQHHFGDYATGEFFIQSLDYHTDNGNPLVRLRRTPHSHAQGRMLTYDRLWVDMKVGVGADGIGQGTDPRAMLRYSDDGGRNWSNFIECSIGKIGETLTRVEFNALGSSRDRVFEFSVSDNVTVVLIAAFADVRIGR